MKKEEYIELIISKLNNSIEVKNEKILTDWLDSNVENQAVFNDLSALWHRTEKYKTSFDPNKTKAWENIQTQISKNNEAKIIPLKRISLMKNVAVLVLLIASGFFVNTLLNNKIIIKTTAKNEVKQIVLPDGSTIDLNENSRISYVKNFKRRQVQLSGEAFFDVKKDATKPFSVQANETEAFVLGTQFNLNTNLNSKIELTLISGKIKFKAKNNSVVLNPGEKISYNKTDQIIEKEKKDIENDIAWKTNVLVFNNTNIIDVIHTLEKHFDLKIYTQNASSSCVFTGTFKNSNIKTIIETISYSLDAKFSIENENFHLDLLNCI